jgi:outer membrane protein
VKSFLLTSAILLLSVFITSGQAQTQQKIGYVDSEIMLKTLPEAIKAQGELDKIAKGWYAQADSMTTALQSDYASYQKQQGTMNSDKLKEAQQNIVNKEQELNQFKQTKFGQGGDLYKKQEDLFAPVKEKIMKGIQEVAKEEGMNFVFDKAGDVLLLYADAQYDITYKVLDKLKRGK